MILRNLIFAGLSVLLALVLAVAIATHLYPSSENLFMSMLVRHHVLIMLLLAILAVSFGFFLASLSIKESSRQKSALQNVLATFLDKQDSIVLFHLAESSATQAELARLEGMTKVRVHRTVKKLEQKGLVRVSAEGKVRRVELTQDIERILSS